MFEINNLFICDSIEEAKFSKVNVFGMNAGTVVSLASVPYNLTTNMVVAGRVDEEIKDLSFKITLSDAKGRNKQSYRKPISEHSPKPKSALPFFVVQPLIIALNTYGTMEITVYKEKEEKYKQTYLINPGLSPNLKNPTFIPISQLFSGQASADNEFIKTILGNATSSITILDSYIDPDSLLNLLERVSSEVVIQVITSPKNKNKFSIDPRFNNKYKNSEVKFTKSYHDRFIKINDTEFYHFGHSLKDISSGKISRFSKLLNKSEMDDFDVLFLETWKNASKL